MVRVQSDWCLGINWIKSDWFFIVFIKQDTKRFSDWFGMIRIGSDSDIGIVLIKWIQDRNDSDWIWLKIRFGSISSCIDRIENLVSDWFGFSRIDVLELIGLSRIDFWPFFIKRDSKRFSDWFGMIRNGSDTDIRMNWNNSDWLGMNFNPILSPGKQNFFRDPENIKYIS